jgi:hypothetical protein
MPIQQDGLGSVSTAAVDWRRTYALGKALASCTIPPAIATPLIKGGREDPSAIGSTRNGQLCKSCGGSPSAPMLSGVPSSGWHLSHGILNPIQSVNLLNR